MTDLRLKKFIEYYRICNYSPNTLSIYAYTFRKFITFMRNKRLDRASRKDVVAFLDANNHLAPSTRQSLQGALRSYFEMLLAHGLIIANPIANLILPKVRNLTRRPTLTTDEIEKLLAVPDIDTAIGIRNRAILELLYSSAIRRCELLNLTVYDVDLAAGFVMIRLGKGGKDRKVPIGNHAVRWIKRYLERGRGRLDRVNTSPNLFLTTRGTRLSAFMLRVMITACAKEAGITRKVTPHLFRHTAATEMLRNGAPLRYVQEMLGHSSLSSTQIYTRVLPRDLETMINKCHPSCLRRFVTPRWRATNTRIWDR